MTPTTPEETQVRCCLLRVTEKLKSLTSEDLGQYLEQMIRLHRFLSSASLTTATNSIDRSIWSVNDHVSSSDDSFVKCRQTVIRITWNVLGNDHTDNLFEVITNFNNSDNILSLKMRRMRGSSNAILKEMSKK
ncbi:unnamed protein product [Spodoptera exigua]|nr:unnamed protein product [Spodoptera exigua]